MYPHPEYFDRVEMFRRQADEHRVGREMRRRRRSDRRRGDDSDRAD